MSFRCQSCRSVVWGQPVKKVVETRRKTYVNKDQYGHDKLTEGYETVKELCLCHGCSRG